MFRRNIRGKKDMEGNKRLENLKNFYLKVKNLLRWPAVKGQKDHWKLCKKCYGEFKEY